LLGTRSVLSEEKTLSMAALSQTLSARLMEPTTPVIELGQSENDDRVVRGRPTVVVP
jgi:hypothetical protein